MGWKSTIAIKREEAQGLLMKRILSATDQELENALESLGFGDNMDLEYYGRNFRVTDEEEI